MKSLNSVTIVAEIGTFLIFLISVQSGQAYPINASLQAMLIVAVPAILARYRVISLPWTVVAWTFVLNFLHLIGVRFGLYDAIWWWDIVTHIVSMSLIAVLVLMILLLAEKNDSRVPSSYLFVAFFVIITVTTLGVLWEILEFFFDQMFSMNMQYSLGDTVKDLTVDIMAGLVVVVMSHFYFKKHSKREILDDLGANGSLERFIGRSMNG